MFRLRRLQVFGSAVGRAVVHHDDLGRRLAGMLQDGADAAAHIVNIIVGVDDERVVEQVGLFQQRGDFPGCRHRRPAGGLAFQHSLRTDAGRSAGILNHHAAGDGVGAQAVGGVKGGLLAQRTPAGNQFRYIRPHLVLRRHIVQVEAEHPVKVQDQLQLVGGGQAGAGQIPGDGQAARQIQVGVDGIPKAAAPFVNDAAVIQAGAAAIRFVLPVPDPVAEVGQRFFGGAQRGKGKVHPMAVAHRHTEVAERQRVKAAGGQILNQKDIAGRLGHFGAVGQQMLPVYPIVDVRRAESPLALGDFVLVVRKYVVHAAGVDVKPLAQVFVRHRRAFNVPTGKTLAPGAVPFDVAARLGGFPKGKIAGIAFQRVGVGADAFQQVAAEIAGQFAVVGAAVDIKVDVAAGRVGGAVVHQGADHGQHFGDVMRGPGELVGGQYVQPGLVLPETVGVELGDFGDGFALGQRGQDHLVAAGFHQFLAHMPHVGDVLDVIDRVAVNGQDAADPVGHQVGTQVADVGIAVHRRPAGVHRDAARRDGPDFVNGLGEGIVDTQHTASPLPG